MFMPSITRLEDALDVSFVVEKPVPPRDVTVKLFDRSETGEAEKPADLQVRPSIISTHDPHVLPRPPRRLPRQRGGMTISLHREKGSWVSFRAAGIILLIRHLVERSSRQRSRRYTLVDGLPIGEWFILCPERSRLGEQLVNAI